MNPSKLLIFSARLFNYFSKIVQDVDTHLKDPMCIAQDVAVLVLEFGNGENENNNNNNNHSDIKNNDSYERNDRYGVSAVDSDIFVDIDMDSKKKNHGNYTLDSQFGKEWF